MSTSTKKIIGTLFIAISILLPLGVLLIPKETMAIGCTPVPPVYVPNPLAVQTQTLGSNDLYTQTTQNSEGFKKCILDPLGTIIGKTIIHALTMSIVQWINNGFKGNPSFIQNPGKFFEGIGDKVAGKIIEQVAPFLCSPFKLDLSLSLALSYGVAPYEDDSCTLTQVEGNVNGAVQDVSQQANNIGNGGWKNWIHVQEEPNNNADGAFLKARAKVGASVNVAQGTLNTALSWGQGFMGLQDCSSDAKNTYSKQQGGKVYDGNNQPVYGVSPDQSGCITKTPGVIIEGQLHETLNSDLRGLEVAQSLDQIFGALVGQLVKQAMGGIGGLSGASSGDSGSGLDPNNLNLGQDLPPIPITGSCQPNKDAAGINNDPVTWKVYTSNQADLTYDWSGDEISSSTILGSLFSSGSSTLQMFYTSAGMKHTTVKVSQNNHGDLTAQNNSATFTCSPDVLISSTTPYKSNYIAAPNLGPQDKTGSADLQCVPSNTSVPIDGAVSYNVIDASAASTTQYSYSLSSTDSALVKKDHVSNDPANDTGITLSQFNDPGDKALKVSVTKKDGQQWFVNCPVVTVNTFTCSPSVQSINTGSLFFWNLKFPDGAPSDNIRQYTWSGAGLLGDLTHATVQGEYGPNTPSGQKSVSVTISEQNAHYINNSGDWKQRDWTINCSPVYVSGSN